MDEGDWALVDAAGDDGTLPPGAFTGQECETAYRRGILDKTGNPEVPWALGSFHKRIDCLMRGERERFDALPREVRETIADYEQDIGLWVLPYREEGVNQRVVRPLPLEKALDYIDGLDCEFSVQQCDCKVYREGDHGLTETCVQFITPESLPNSSLDRGHARPLPKEELKDLLVAADRAGYVHNCDGNGLCNCCACCCWALRGIGDYRASGHDVFAEYVDAAWVIEPCARRCRGCGACVDVCPVGALQMSESGTIEVDAGLCIGCGVCRARCRFGALSITDRR